MDTLAQILAAIYMNLTAIGFTNVSVTSIYGAIANAISVIIYNTIVEINNTVAIINNLQTSQWGYGSSNYYVTIALQFQLGYNLTPNPNINPVTGDPYLYPYYSTIDTNAQIISQAALQATPQGGSIVLFLKVASLGISEGLGPLTSDQLAAFTSYMLTFEIVGLPLNIISIPGNVLFFNSTATYLSSYDLPTLEANLQTALTNFQTTFKFNGEFYVTDLEQYIQTNVPGMRNFFISNTELDGIAFSDYTNLSSGFFNYDPNTLTSIVFNPVVS